MKLLLEGIDRLGKTSISNEVINKLGYHTYIHMSKPVVLKRYKGSAIGNPLKAYQRESFNNMFKLLESNANIIFDRAHLGETVYSPGIRGYDGGYVWDMEKKYDTSDVRLVLLYADVDFDVEDDGNSVQAFSLRPSEQEEFKRAFERSLIANKRMVKVNEGDEFRPMKDILREVIGV